MAEVRALILRNLIEQPGEPFASPQGYAFGICQNDPFFVGFIHDRVYALVGLATLQEHRDLPVLTEADFEE